MDTGRSRCGEGRVGWYKVKRDNGRRHRERN
jgi:hypothetical protein